MRAFSNTTRKYLRVQESAEGLQLVLGRVHVPAVLLRLVDLQAVVEAAHIELPVRVPARASEAQRSTAQHTRPRCEREAAEARQRGPVHVAVETQEGAGGELRAQAGHLLLQFQSLKW